MTDLLDGISIAGMTVGELDGYVAALIVNPEMFWPSRWLPGAWVGEGAFTDRAGAQVIVAEKMEHYDRIAHELAKEPALCEPVIEVAIQWRRSIFGPLDQGLRTTRLCIDARVAIVMVSRRNSRGFGDYDPGAEHHWITVSPMFDQKAGNVLYLSMAGIILGKWTYSVCAEAALE